jgi:RNA ligase (TIGR02306 family)
MSERKLATIRTIEQILPIEGADSIELAVVGGWKVVVAKDVGHKVGDKVVYCEVDSFLPIRPEFEFLRKSSYKKMGDAEGFRLRTVKLRGQISQGLILPMHIFVDYNYRVSADLLNDYAALEPDKVVISPDEMIEVRDGVDVSKVLGIVKYEPPIPAELAGIVKGPFPSSIPKTDEERIQNLTEFYDEYKKQTYIETEKMEGSSTTYFLLNGEFGVCSRNLELLESETNTLWKVARQLNVKEKLEKYGKNLAIQGELIGEGVQGNIYKLKGQTVAFYTAFDIDAQRRLTPAEMIGIFRDLELPTVPVLKVGATLPDSIDELIKMADGKAMLASNVDREGLVFRSLDGTISFKVISNKYLLNEKD